MPVSTPTVHQIREIASRYRPDLTEEDVADFRQIMQGTLASYRRLDELPEPKLPVQVPRTPGYRPSMDENPYNGGIGRPRYPAARRACSAESASQSRTIFASPACR
jgi:hypothetical protein